METLHEFYVFTKGTEYLIAVLLLILFPLFWSYLNKPRRLPKPALVKVPDEAAVAPDQVPAGVFVGPGHAWLQLAPAGSVTVGSGRLPLMLLGGLERAELKPLGSEVRRGEPVAVLRHGERSVLVRAPVAGTIDRVNSVAAADLRQLAGDPFGRGWLVRIAPRGLAPALREMFVAEEAGAWMRRELQRLRDFLAGLGEANQALAPATLADGGLPVHGLATLLSEPAWEELSEQFFTLTPQGQDQPIVA